MRREHEKTYIYGKHALNEAIRNKPDVIRKVFLSPEIEDKDLRDSLKRLQIPVAVIKTKEASRMVGQDISHQGVIAVVDSYNMLVDFASFASELKPDKDTALVILDELTDPHNVGAIIRSAAAFGISGVLIPSHNQAPITGAVVKTSAGMAFRIPLIAIGNVNYTISHLKEMGFKIYGLAMEGSRSLSKEIFDSPALFVVGNEGSGIREKTLELCDVSLRIPMNPRCESLNAAASTAVVLYQWSVGHANALKEKKG
jgi:23S rRNA (guanosine2251-2'-O)-methyltransferase